MSSNLTTAEWLMLPFNIAGLWAKIGLCYLESFYRMFVPRPMKSLRNKVILITGAGQGIGRQLALKFGALDTRLALWDINKTGCEETADMVKENGGTAFAYKCDITDIDAVKQAASETRRDLGDVDVVVNNAGIMVVKPFMKLTQSDIRRTFDINIVAHFWILQEFLPAMMDKNEGHVVTISSMAGRIGSPLLTDYCGSKWAAFGFTEALNEEMRKFGKDIKTTTVCPIFVNTNLVHGISDRASWRMKFGKMLEPDEVAQAIVDGMRRDNRYVYLPPDLERSVKIGPLFPVRARNFINDFVDAGFDEIQ